MFKLFAAIGLAVAVPTTALAQPPLEAFAQREDRQYSALSPDGTYLAYLSSDENGAEALVVHNLATGELQLRGTNAWRTVGIEWSTNTIVMMEAMFHSDIRGVGIVDISGRLSFDVENGLAPEFVRQPTLNNPNAGQMLGIEPDTGYVITPVRLDSGQIELRAINPRTRSFRRLGFGGEDTVDWAIDNEGRAVARLDYSQTRNRTRLRRNTGENTWPIIDEIEDAQVLSYRIVGLLPDGDLAVQTRLQNPETDARASLYAMSMEDGQFTALLSGSSELDLYEVIRDPWNNAPAGVMYRDERRAIDWLNADLLALHDEIAELTGTFPVIESWSRDRQRILFTTESENAPRQYVIYDRVHSELVPMGSGYVALDGVELPNRRPYAITARDGTSIPGYLTTPIGDGPFPTVIMPHGGPASRDYGGFDAMAHFLASRGYAVYQPNFRGSRGYGLNWESAGRGGWGRGIMQHDVTDSRRHLIEAGIASADRTCVVGASYGGYAALAASVYTPDEFQCAAAFAPVADLRRQYRYALDNYGRHHWVITHWNRVLADQDNRAGSRMLEDLSPMEHVDQITIPVLLVHGEHDTVVPIDQSRRFEREASRAGVDVELIELELGDHWLRINESRMAWFEAVEAFLAEHIGE